MTTLKVTAWRQLAPPELPGGRRYLTAHVQRPSADVKRTQAKSEISSPGSPPCVPPPFDSSDWPRGQRTRLVANNNPPPPSRLSKCHFQAVYNAPRDYSVTTTKKILVSFGQYFTQQIYSGWGKMWECESMNSAKPLLVYEQTVFLIMTLWRTVLTVLTHCQMTHWDLVCICVCFSCDSRRSGPQWIRFCIVALHKIKTKSLDEETSTSVSEQP